jgi:hypothetical protein
MDQALILMVITIVIAFGSLAALAFWKQSRFKTIDMLTNR